MLIQPADNCIRSITDITFVRLDTEVNSPVVNKELVPGHEALVAQLAGERLHTKVGHHVHLVAGLGVEGLPTVLTHKLLLSMLQHMFVQVPEQEK